MTALQDFFHMGGYAFYVWTSYGLCAVVMILNVLQSISREKNTLGTLVKRQRRTRG